MIHGTFIGGKGGACTNALFLLFYFYRDWLLAFDFTFEMSQNLGGGKFTLKVTNLDKLTTKIYVF